MADASDALKLHNTMEWNGTIFTKQDVLKAFIFQRHWATWRIQVLTAQWLTEARGAQNIWRKQKAKITYCRRGCKLIDDSAI